MADNFTFPIGSNTYVPGLSLDLMVEFTRPEYPINRYIGRQQVDKQLGYYVNMRNDNQARYQSSNNYVWSDGADAPKVLGTGSDSFDYPAYTCKRYAYVEQLGHLAVEQCSWDLLGQAVRLRTAQANAVRSQRVATALTTSGNFPSANVAATATALAGGPWTSATSTNPYIKLSVLKALNIIVKATNGVVNAKDLKIVMNPNTAITVSTSQEFIDFLKQSPDSMAIFEGNNFNSRFGLPGSLYGVELVVDDTVVLNTAPGAATQTQVYTIADNVFFMVTKQNAISPSVGKAFSTFELLQYKNDWEVFVDNDVKNRRYDIQIIENTAEQLFAPQSGFLCSNVAS